MAPPHGGFSEAERTMTYAYDTDSQLTSVAGPVAGATTTYKYDAYGRVWRVTDSDGYTVTTQYHALDRPITSIYPDGTYTRIGVRDLLSVFERAHPRERRRPRS